MAMNGFMHASMRALIHPTVPLPAGPFTCALGRAIRVEVQGDTRWFTTWYAPNTLMDGSTEKAATRPHGKIASRQTRSPAKHWR